jgi:hypothetical protein
VSKGFLRSPDDRFDGYQVDPEVTGDEFSFGRKDDNRRFIRHDVRCGTANWIEFWEEGYTPPYHDEKDRGKRGS